MAIGTKLGGHYVGIMLDRYEHWLTGFRIPHSYCFVRRRRYHSQSIGTKLSGHDCIFVLQRICQGPARLCIPNPRCLVERCRPITMPRVGKSLNPDLARLCIFLLKADPMQKALFIQRYFVITVQGQDPVLYRFERRDLLQTPLGQYRA